MTYSSVCRLIRLRSVDGTKRTGASFKTLRHMEALLMNRVRKADALLKIAAEVIRRMQPNPRKRALLGIPVRANFRLFRQDANRIVGVSSAAGCQKDRSEAASAIKEDMVRYFAQNPGQGFSKIFAAILKGQPYSQQQLLKVYGAAKLKLGEREPTTKIGAPLPDSQRSLLSR